jgi:hypothetical protein
MERLLLLPQSQNSFQLKEVQNFLTMQTLTRPLKKKLEVSQLMRHALSMKAK